MVARLSQMTTRDLVRIVELERDVILDPLTGAYNRRYLDMKLAEEHKQASDNSTPLSVLVIDLDYFKRINDTYGHSVDDLVLRHVSSLIMDRVRANDSVVRYGGEEFVVLAPGIDLENAAMLGEHVRSRIAERHLLLPDGRKLVVTASIGIASLDGGERQSELLQRADQALYEAKRTGRDRICKAIGGACRAFHEAA